MSEPQKPDLGKVIADSVASAVAEQMKSFREGLSKELEALKPPAPTPPSPEKVTLTERIQKLESNAVRVKAGALKNTLLSAAQSVGVPEEHFDVFLPYVTQKFKFEVTDDMEVLAIEGDTSRPAADYVKSWLQNDPKAGLFRRQQRGRDARFGGTQPAIDISSMTPEQVLNMKPEDLAAVDVAITG